MKTRFITAFVLIVLLLPPALLGGVYFKILALLLSFGYVNEMINVFSKQYHVLTRLCFYIMGLYCWATGCFFDDYFNISLVLSLLWICVLAVVDNEANLADLAIYYFVHLIMTYLIKGIIVAREDSIYELIFLLMGTFFTDTFALFVGKAIGKHKLCPRISPNKTIEGFLGAYVLTTISLIVYSYVCFDTLTISKWLLCFALPLFGQIGDLVFSLIKRHYNVKDFGNIFPGHGGILDRFDSLSFNCMIYLIITVVCI